MVHSWPHLGSPRAMAWLRAIRPDLIAIIGLALLGVAVSHNVLGAGFPPGVDTPTFLHMSWFTQETLGGRGGFTDPYWYGGFAIYTTYPPLSYGLVGALAALPGIGFVFIYKLVLLFAYIGIALAIYALGRQLGFGRPWAAFGGVLVLLAYPVLVAAGLWGRYSSVVALPLAVLSLVLLERAHEKGSRKYAVLSGASLGLSFLAHHMTAGAIALGLPGWFLFYHFTERQHRAALVRVTGTVAVVAFVSTVWWVVPWLNNLVQAGFERETPGLWSFSLTRYVQALTERDLIGVHTYPSYIGIGLATMLIGGLLRAFLSPSRITPYAVLLVVLVAFSLGEQINPLIRVEPLTGLDVARFQFYMAPFIVLVGLPFIASLASSAAQFLRARGVAPRAASTLAGLIVVLLAGQALWDASAASQELFRPYRVTEGTRSLMAWLDQEGREGKVLGVGFWHWDDFLLPYTIQRPVVDGWHDEGARNWETVRQLRLMMWTGAIDIPRAYELLSELGGRYIAVQQYAPGESPQRFRSKLREHPQLFTEVADWGEVTLFERR